MKNGWTRMGKAGKGIQNLESRIPKGEHSPQRRRDAEGGQQKQEETKTGVKRVKRATPPRPSPPQVAEREKKVVGRMLYPRGAHTFAAERRKKIGAKGVKRATSPRPSPPQVAERETEFAEQLMSRQGFRALVTEGQRKGNRSWGCWWIRG